MRIGIIIFYKNTHGNKKTGIWGEEIVSYDIAEGLRNQGVDCDIYAMEDEFTRKPLDVAIYLTDFVPKEFLYSIAKKNILWIQGFNYDYNGKIIDLDEIYKKNKDNYNIIMTASKVLADKYKLPFIVPPVNMKKFHHVEARQKYDVAWVGNLIKPPEVTKKFLSPFRHFNYYLAGGDFGKVSHDEFLKNVSESKINLHFGFEESVTWDMVTGRPFYLSACKAFTLMDKVPFFMEHFSDAMEFTNGGDGEKTKIEFYLEHDKPRKEMAEKAYHIVRKNFTSDIIAKKIKEEVLCTLY